MKLFESGNPLPKNIYHAPRAKDKNKKFRYKKPNGQMKTFSVDPASEESIEEQVIRLANDADEHFKAEDFIARKDNGYINSEVGFWVQRYLDDVNQNPEIKGATKKNILSGVKYLDPIAKIKTQDLKKDDLFEIWDGMAYHAQKQMRSRVFACVQMMIDAGKLPHFLEINPFRPKSAGGYKFKAAPQKKRQIMTMEMFLEVREIAESKGLNFLVDAMDISLHTYLRITDVITLRFDDINASLLVKVITKTEGRKKSKPMRHMWDLKQHKGLRNIINRAKLRNSSDNPCPFIIHHDYDVKRDSKTKAHDSQVTRHYLNECIHKCMDEIEELKDVSHAERPSFHEIRALRMALDLDNRKPEDISKDLAHTDARVMTQFYDSHRTHDEHKVGYALELTALEAKA